MTIYKQINVPTVLVHGNSKSSIHATQPPIENPTELIPLTASRPHWISVLLPICNSWHRHPAQQIGDLSRFPYTYPGRNHNEVVPESRMTAMETYLPPPFSSSSQRHPVCLPSSLNIKHFFHSFIGKAFARFRSSSTRASLEDKTHSAPPD